MHFQSFDRKAYVKISLSGKIGRDASFGVWIGLSFTVKLYKYSFDRTCLAQSTPLVHIFGYVQPLKISLEKMFCYLKQGFCCFYWSNNLYIEGFIEFFFEGGGFLEQYFQVECLHKQLLTISKRILLKVSFFKQFL